VRVFLVNGDVAYLNIKNPFNQSTSLLPSLHFYLCFASLLLASIYVFTHLGMVQCASIPNLSQRRYAKIWIVYVRMYVLELHGILMCDALLCANSHRRCPDNIATDRFTVNGQCFMFGLTCPSLPLPGVSHFAVITGSRICFVCLS